MRISYHSHSNGLDLSQGYGIAGYNIVQSLQHLGYGTPFNRGDAEIILNFTQPPYYQFYGRNQINIGYTPWESSIIDPAWKTNMMRVDHLWTTSDLVARWFKDNGVDRDINIFEHGIDHAWNPHLRKQHGPFKFLHVGSDMTRKGGQEVVDAFLETFGPNNPDVQLTLKTHSPYTMVRIYAGPGDLRNPFEYAKNIKHVHGTIPLDHLIQLFNDHDCFVYPSYGEGFGLMPLQAMASGMPTITIPEWAPYRRFIDNELKLESDLTDSPWPEEHPGKVFKPNIASLAKIMESCVYNYESLRRRAYVRAFQIHEEYDWVHLTRNAFAPVVAKLTSGE